MTVTLDGFRPVDGVVRWSRDSVAGIAFLPELSWQELMLWLKERRKSAFRGRQRAVRAAAAARRARTGRPTQGEEGIALNLPARVREGTRRWAIEVASITTRSVAFDSFAALRVGSLLWIVLPGLEGWPARIVSVEGYRFTCEFTQPLHPAVLERIWRWRRKPRDRVLGLVGLAARAVGVKQGRDQGGGADADRGAGDEVLGACRGRLFLVRSGRAGAAARPGRRRDRKVRGPSFLTGMCRADFDLRSSPAKTKGTAGMPPSPQLVRTGISDAGRVRSCPDRPSGRCRCR